MSYLRVCVEGSDAGETERLEELPLCSCRMEAPRVDSASRRPNRLCMATESVNGEVCVWLCTYSLCDAMFSLVFHIFISSGGKVSVEGGSGCTYKMLLF